MNTEELRATLEARIRVLKARYERAVSYGWWATAAEIKSGIDHLESVLRLIDGKSPDWNIL